MLKRLQNKKTASQSSISSPVLVETTLDQDVYHKLNDAGLPLDENVEWQPQILKTKRQQQPRTLPPLSFPLLESLQEQSPPQAKFRPASSVYSQPSPNIPLQYFPRDTIYEDDIEISPPSTPELELAMNFNRFRSRAEESVSPIDETEEPISPPPESRPPSRSIPVLRREKRRNDAAAHAANIQSRRTPSATVNGNGLRKTSAAPKYDPYTGEPTTDEKGRPQQVKPSAFSGGDRPVHDNHNGMGTRTSVTAGASQSSNASGFADRIRRLRDKNPAAVPEEKPAWRGASGRQPVVSLPTQSAEAKPYSVPRKDVRRVTAPQPKKNYSGLALDVRDEYSDGETRFVASPNDMHPAYRERYGGGRNSDEDSFTESPTELQYSTTTTTTAKTDNPYVLPPHDFSKAYQPNRKYTSTTTAAQQVSISDLHDISVGGVERNFRDALKESNLTMPTKYADGQLPSKFSVTTYDPSPRPSSDSNHWTPSDAPPLPNNSSQSPPNRAATTPIVNRRRPRVPSIDSTKSSVPARKPVANAPSTPTVSMSSNIKDTKKDLPLTPGEKAAQAQDLCVVLQAQLDALARRRANLEKSIYQMTELMPVDGMMGGIGGAFAGGGTMRHHIIGAGNNGQIGNSYGGSRQRGGPTVMTEKFTEKRREEEKLKVEQLRQDLADVRIEEHQVGLRLHRAWKRRDEGAVYEPTGLWVRRITG